jgi:hypothetical protein
MRNKNKSFIGTFKYFITLFIITLTFGGKAVPYGNSGHHAAMRQALPDGWLALADCPLETPEQCVWAVLTCELPLK